MKKIQLLLITTCMLVSIPIIPANEDRPQKTQRTTYVFGAHGHINNALLQQWLESDHPEQCIPVWHQLTQAQQDYVAATAAYRLPNLCNHLLDAEYITHKTKYADVPLISWAYRGCNDQMILRLLDTGATLEKADNGIEMYHIEGTPLLYYAIKYENYDAIDTLLARPNVALIDTYGNTAVHWGATYHDSYITSNIITQYPYLAHQRNHTGVHPLETLITEKTPITIAHRNTPDARDPEFQETIRVWLRHAVSSGNTHMLHRIIPYTHPTDFAQEEPDYAPPLVTAAERGYTDMIDIMRKRTACDPHWWTELLSHNIEAHFSNEEIEAAGCVPGEFTEPVLQRIILSHNQKNVARSIPHLIHTPQEIQVLEHTDDGNIAAAERAAQYNSHHAIRSVLQHFPREKNNATGISTLERICAATYYASVHWNRPAIASDILIHGQVPDMHIDLNTLNSPTPAVTTLCNTINAITAGDQLPTPTQTDANNVTYAPAALSYAMHHGCDMYVLGLLRTIRQSHINIPSMTYTSNNPEIDERLRAMHHLITKVNPNRIPRQVLNRTITGTYR